MKTDGNEYMAGNITLHKVSNFIEYTCCYTRIKMHWKIFPYPVSWNGWKQMDSADGPEAVCVVVIPVVIMDC